MNMTQMELPWKVSIGSTNAKIADIKKPVSNIIAMDKAMSILAASEAAQTNSKHKNLKRFIKISPGRIQFYLVFL